MNVKCLVIGHKWTTTYSEDGTDQQVCARCGKKFDLRAEDGLGSGGHDSGPATGI